MAQSNDGVYVFDSAKNNGLSDIATIAALSGNGGFGGMNNPFWMMFMLPFIYPFFGSMMGGNGWFGNWGGGNGGYLANQLNNDTGRDLILQAINGRADALGQIAQILNTSVSAVQNGINSLNTDIVSLNGDVKLTGAQIINAIQAGDANLASQLAQCCCENRLAICQQTNTLTSQLASHDASVRLQLAQNEAADQLSVCQQTNTLLNAINNQTVAMNEQFCALKERELQNKIDTQGDIITQLRNQISNDKQTEAFTSAFNTLNEKINILSAKSPNTVPVVYPNLTAVNNTPYATGFNPWGYGFGGQSYWG